MLISFNILIIVTLFQKILHKIANSTQLSVWCHQNLMYLFARGSIHWSCWLLISKMISTIKTHILRTNPYWTSLKDVVNRVSRNRRIIENWLCYVWTWISKISLLQVVLEKKSYDEITRDRKACLCVQLVKLSVTS